MSYACIEPKAQLRIQKPGEKNSERRDRESVGSPVRFSLSSPLYYYCYYDCTRRSTQTWSHQKSMCLPDFYLKGDADRGTEPSFGRQRKKERKREGGNEFRCSPSLWLMPLLSHCIVADAFTPPEKHTYPPAIPEIPVFLVSS